MKKCVLFILSCILVLSVSVPCFAESDTNLTRETEYYEDGSYAIIETEIIQDEAAADSVAATNSTKTAKRTYEYYNSNKEKAWALTLTGTFQYNGSTSKATAASASSKIYINGWKCSSKSASKSGATAKATGKFTYKGTSKSKSIGLKCSASGKISPVNY